MMKGFLPEQQRTDRIVAAVKIVSDQTGRSMAQVALSWLRYRAVPVIPIIGARKLSQLQDNLASFDLTLSADQLKTLDEASRIETRVPARLLCKGAAPNIYLRRSARPDLGINALRSRDGLMHIVSRTIAAYHDNIISDFQPTKTICMGRQNILPTRMNLEASVS